MQELSLEARPTLSRQCPLVIENQASLLLVAYSVYDYISNLKGLPYPSEEYIQKREEVT
jgi:hypothetical protein